jgi:hypothetical protein
VKRRIIESVVAVFFVARALGCDDSINKGWLVDRTRVLGERVEAKAEPARAAIGAAEPLRLTWLVGAPDGTGHLGWAFAVCAPVVGNFPEPRCEGPVFASGAGASDGELVTMELTAPTAAELGTLQSLQVLAAFCEGGAATLDAARFTATCEGGAEARLAAGSIRLAAAGPNRNPEVATDAVLFDGAALAPALATTRAGTPCVGQPTSPVVNAGSEHTFTLRFRGDEREEGETILASHQVTTGELKRQYSSLDPGDPAPKDVTIDWTAPPDGEVGDGGRLAEIFFVLRDGRGGQAFARRTLCVRRAP